MPVPNPVMVGPVSIGRGRPLALICGPCVMEPGDLTRIIAGRLVEICSSLKVPLIFKASFDKANRTSKSRTCLRICWQDTTRSWKRQSTCCSRRSPANRPVCRLRRPLFRRTHRAVLCRRSLDAGSSASALNLEVGSPLRSASAVDPEDDGIHGRIVIKAM